MRVYLDQRVKEATRDPGEGAVCQGLGAKVTRGIQDHQVPKGPWALLEWESKERRETREYWVHLVQEAHQGLE